MTTPEESARFDLHDMPAIEGAVLVDDRGLAWASEDWGHLVRLAPRAVVRPTTVADVAAVVRFACARGIPVAARGAGHSPFGQAQVAGGLVLDMSGLVTIREIGDHQVSVDAGARWSEVVAATARHGLTPLVLTDYLGLTVGGTLAVGGLGGTSSRYGSQTDTLLDLVVVTGAGDTVVCSPHRRQALFDGARAGLGQCGVITQATLRLAPAPERARRWKLLYGSLDPLVAHQRTAVLDGRFDYLEGHILSDEEPGRWQYVLEAVAYYSPPAEPPESTLLDTLTASAQAVDVDDLSYLEFLDRMRETEEELRADGSWHQPHPWLNLLLPDESVEPLVSKTLTETQPTDLGRTGLILLYPIRSRSLRTPLLRRPSSEIVWLLALLRTSDAGEREHAEEMIHANTRIYREARRIGATLYPTTALPMSPEDWRHHFGPIWNDVQNARRRFDPNSVLTPSHGIPAPTAEKGTR